jgi:hypothetical protein
MMHQVERAAQRFAGSVAGDVQQVFGVEQVGHRRRCGGDVEDLALTHDDHAGTVDLAVPPDAADQQRVGQIGR